MKKYLQTKCDEVLEMLHKRSQEITGSSVMTFEQSASEDCSEAMKLIAEMARLKQEEKDHLEALRIAEEDYQEQFAPDGRGWSEV